MKQQKEKFDKLIILKSTIYKIRTSKRISKVSIRQESNKQTIFDNNYIVKYLLIVIPNITNITIVIKHHYLSHQSILQKKQLNKKSLKQMINMKLQNMKQAAYFDYFKSFSLNAFDTIKKLQTQFKQQIQQSFFFDPNLMFKRVKTLLGSYQILIYEINDSCQFVQIPQFGNCILKIFLQIMSIIRFLLHKIVQKSPRKQDSSPLIDRTNSIHKPIINMTQTNLGSVSSTQQQKLIYKKKQQSKYLINNLKQQLSILQMQQTQSIQTSKKQFRTIIQGKQKLQSIQISQNQNILSQALNNFCKKGQHLKNFVNVRQAAMINNMKQGVGQYMKLKDILDQDSNTKLSTASTKLQQLFKTHTLNYIKQKQSQMKSQSIQVHIQQPLQNKLLEQNKNIKKLNDLIKKLNDQIAFQKQKNKSLQNLLKSKIQQFQLKTMQYRVAKIQMDNLRSKHQKILQSTSQFNQSTNNHITNNSTKHQLCANCQNKKTNSPQYKRTQLDCVSKSIIQGQQNQQFIQQQTDRINDDIMQNPSRLMEKINKRLHYQNPNSLTKKQLAYRPIDTKSEQLQLYSLLWQIKIQPTYQPNQIKRQLTKKRTIIGKNNNGNNTGMNNTNIFRDNKRTKTKILTSQSKNSMDVQRVFNFSYIGNKSGINDSNTKMLGIKKYSKKISQSTLVGLQNQGLVRQMTENWSDNDQVNQSQYDNLKDNNQPAFQRNKLSSFQSEHSNCGQNNLIDYVNQQKLLNQNKDYKLFQTFAQRSSKINVNSKFSEQQLKSLNAYPTSKKKLSKSQSNIFSKGQLLSGQNDQNNQIQQGHDSFQLGSLSRMVSSPNNIRQVGLTIIKEQLKYPKFIKYNNQHKIQLNMRDLNNIYIDVNTAKNFEYINLFHNDDLRVSSSTKGKGNKALNVNIQHMQKKNFINNLIYRVKGQVNNKNTFHNGSNRIICNTQSVQQSSSIKQQKPIMLNQSKFMNSTFSGSLMKTQFWNQFINLQSQITNNQKLTNNQKSTSNQKSTNNEQLMQNLLKCYDFQSLVAILFKQLKDLKRSTAITQHHHQSLQMNNYQILRNFLRYPYSAITLQNDKNFLQKQKQQSSIQYLQLRKIMQRIFKLHKNCKIYNNKNTFEKLTINQYTQQLHHHQSQDKDQIVLCTHMIDFYQNVGILLLPKSNRVVTQIIQENIQQQIKRK